jgi:hypothetical protein
MRVCESDPRDTDRAHDETSRERKQSRDRKKISRDLKAVKELLRSRGQSKERRRFEAMTIHR